MSTTFTASRSLLRGVRHLLIVMTLAVAALLLPVSAPVAHAGPPGVTASENPVVITIHTKEITLTWALAPFEPAGKLTVTESDTPAPVLDQTVSSLTGTGTGTVPLTVTVGKTYTAQLTDAFTNKPVGAPLTITTKKADIAAPGLGCKLDCITRVHADEIHGDWAQFTITTNTPASIELEITPMKQNQYGEWEVYGGVSVYDATNAPTQSWTPTLAGLAPNTRYNVFVRAHDGWGNESLYGLEYGGNGGAHFNTPSG